MPEIEDDINEVEKRLMDRSIRDKVADLRQREASGEELGDLEKKFLEVYEGIKKMQEDNVNKKIEDIKARSRAAGENLFPSEEEEKKQKEEEEKNRIDTEE